MNRLHMVIAFTLCLTGFFLDGSLASCLNFNYTTWACDCCRSGWTGQNCTVKCLNCGSSYVQKKCETFCQNASFYGPLCDIQCPAACLRNGQCNTTCATPQDPTKDHDDLEAAGTGACSQRKVTFSPQMERNFTIITHSVVAIAICYVWNTLHKTGLTRKCKEGWKACQDYRKRDAIDSSKQAEDASTHGPLLDKEISQPIQVGA